MSNMRTAFTCVGLLVSGATIPSLARAATCEELTTFSSAQTRVTLAQSVGPGAFTPPAGRAGGSPTNPFGGLPAFCRVAATLNPTPRSDIKIEVWLPAGGWNGKLLVVGNGAFAGTISYPAMATALAAGYAAASTDTGHTGPASNTFVTEDAIVDFAYRAIHETTAAAKRIVDARYGSAPKFAYFNGCSTGGRQALTAAQRFPEDFNGIVAGAPAISSSTQAFGQVWIYQAAAEPAAALPREKLSRLHDAVLQQCDMQDGVKDGVLENPLACTFDPRQIVCTEGKDPSSCLTAPQVTAAQRIYAGASNPKTGEKIFPGLARGSESGWNPMPVGYAVDYFKYIVFKDPGWEPKTLTFDRDITQATKPANHIFDATDADLTKFVSRGGKLIMYQGWADPGIPPANIVRYYDEVQRKTKKASDSVRLFMVPGMGHCGGGDGTSTFDMMSALDRWAETGVRPDRINASRVRQGVTDRSRPLCAWPQVAAYKGSGSTDDAANFVCKPGS